MSHFPELERLYLQKLNVLSELQRLGDKEKALRERVSALEKLESIRCGKLASKTATGILEEKLEFASLSLPRVSFEWGASPAKVKELYMT